MTDAHRKDSPSGVLPSAVPNELDGWGTGPRVSGGMTPVDALPSQVGSNAIEQGHLSTAIENDRISLWDVTCGIEPPESIWLIDQDFLCQSDPKVAAAVDLEAFYRFRDVLRAAPADTAHDAPLTVDTRTALVIARLLLKKLS